MSTAQLIKFGVQQFWKRPGLMLVFTVVPTAIGFLLLAAFVFSDPTASTPNADPTEIWRSMSVYRKFGVFAMIPLNTWIPFALGQAGVAWMVAASIRGQDFGFIDVLRVVLRSARSLVPLFFLLTFLWIPAHTMMFFPGLVVAWFIGFTPMVVAIGGEGSWRAVRTSVRMARQGQSFMLWLWAFFGVLAILLTLVIAFANLPPGYHVRNFVSHVIFVILIATLECVLNCALTRIYLQIPPADGAGNGTSEAAGPPPGRQSVLQ